MEEKIIKDLGSFNEKVLFFGGVYSNLQALQALKRWADENGYPSNNIFCTGDILGYCAQPLECIELIKEWNIRSIAGNVEIQIRNEEDDCGCDFKSGGRCDLFSRNWYAYTQSKMTGESKEWLHKLPHHIQFWYQGKRVTIVHGSWFNTSDFIFYSTPWHVKQQNFDATGSDIIVGGHCGLPFAHEQDGKLWLNAGVIGMPANDGTSEVWFATFEEGDTGMKYQFHRLQYDYEEASELMRKNGLPQSYANTLHTGIWDNCEILPEEETAHQGKRIEFSSHR